MKQLFLAAVAIASFIGFGQAVAAPINVAANRQVIVGDIAEGDYSGPNSPSAALGNFSDSVAHSFSPTSPNTNPIDASAQQATNIDAGTGVFSGTGSVAVGYNSQQMDGVFANSIFDLTFDLATAHSYILSGSVMASNDGGRAETYFQLFDASSNPVINFDAIANDSLFDPSVSLASSGVLGAGSYHLLVATIFDNCVNSRTSTGQNNPCGPNPGSYMGTSDIFTNFDFNLRFVQSSSVPEPPTFALLGVALAGLAFIRRRGLRPARGSGSMRSEKDPNFGIR